MIKISRSSTGPKSFTKKGATQRVRECSDYDLSPTDYRSGKKKFDTKRTIYASKAVKQKLSKSQHNKCCYCETKFRAAIFLAVEHFRPKTAVRQSRKSKAECPGYYWLAYEWSNLLLSCHECNSTWKQLLFPLSNPKKRSRSHHDDITIERPMLINPLTEDPRDHIRFRRDAPRPLTKRGKATISIVGLRRAGLRESRLEKLEVLQRFSDLIDIAAKIPTNLELKQLADRAKAFLTNAVSPQAEFSSMAQDFLSNT